jgi:putative sterol carrier protein
VQEKSLALLAAQVAALAEPRQAAAELLVDDRGALPAQRLGHGHGERIGLSLARERDLHLRHSGAMLAARHINSRDQADKERPMGQSVQEFFDTLASRADTTQTDGMNNSYAFDIEGAGQWTVKVTEGNVAVDQGMEDADVTITTSEEVFEKIIAGEQNPTSAYMTGKLKLKGDMGAAMKLQKLF